jgi:PAS domain S-box-containing protein
MPSKSGQNRKKQSPPRKGAKPGKKRIPPQKEEEFPVMVKEAFFDQQKSERRENRFWTHAEHAPDIIARFDRNCRHIYVNTRVEEVLGILAENLISRTVSELGYPEDLVRFWQKKETSQPGKWEEDLKKQEFSVTLEAGQRKGLPLWIKND